MAPMATSTVARSGGAVKMGGGTNKTKMHAMIKLRIVHFSGCHNI